MINRDDVSENGMISEIGNWNAAKTYSDRKIMHPLNLCDFYRDIALYGTSEFADELFNFPIDNNSMRLKATNRLINELLKIVENTIFAMRRDGTKEEMLKYQKQLIDIKEKVFPKLSYTTYNQGTRIQNIVLHEGLFKKTLDLILEIKTKMNEPLNKNDLIFTGKEEFDPKAFKQQLKDRMVNRG